MGAKIVLCLEGRVLRKGWILFTVDSKYGSSWSTVPFLPRPSCHTLFSFQTVTQLFPCCCLCVHSFALVNKISKKFFDSERRYNYTTPKTFLELIKLYKNVLGNKRKATQVNRGPQKGATQL